MRQLLELEALQDTVGAEPALRLGTQAPADVLNLAYVQVPALTSTAAVLAFDRSGLLPENAIPLPPTEKTMFVVPEGGRYYLADDANHQALPAPDWLVTNVFYPVQQGGTTAYLPMYAKATARFYHYEVNPPQLTGSDAAPYGGFGTLNVYQGRHIRLLEHGEPATFPHVIAIAPKGTYLWEVTVYLPWMEDPERRLTLAYHRSNPSGTDRRPSHTETLNPQPYFEEQFEAKGGTITPGSNQPQFMARALPGGETYRIEVTEALTTLSETQHRPLAARVRVKATVGSQVYASPWRSVYLLDKPNVYDVMWGPKDSPVFVDMGDRAARVIFPQAGPAVFGQEWVSKDATYAAELLVWSGTAWVAPDPNTDGVYPIPSGYDPVLAYTTRPCGTPDLSPGRKSLLFPPVQARLTLQGGASWTTPAVDINACNPAAGVYAQVTYPSGRDATLVDNNWDLFERLINLIFPSRTWSARVDSRLEDGLYAYSGILRSMDPPSAQTSTVRIDFRDANGNLGAQYTLDDMTITMGRYGELLAVRLVQPGGATTSLALPAPQSVQQSPDLTLRKYTFTLNDFVATGLELDVRPSVWLVRKVESWFLFFRIYWTNEWQKGLEVVNVEAWQRTPAQPNNWERQCSLPVSVRRGAPERLSILATLQARQMIPDPGVPTESIRYGITLAGADPAASLPSILLSLTEGVPVVSNPRKILTIRHPSLLARVFWKNLLP